MQMNADGLAAKYKIPGTIEVSKDAPSPHCNAWKWQPHIKFDLDNFPKMQSKKAWHSDDASATMAKTALTDKCTEFDTQMQMMRNSFADQLKIIKEDGAKQDTEAKRHITNAKQTYNKAQEAMLTKYKMIHESITKSCMNYITILKHQNKLSIHLQTHDNETHVQSNAFAQVLASTPVCPQ